MAFCNSEEFIVAKLGNFFCNFVRFYFAINTYSSVSKYWNMSEEDYVREAEKERYHMDNYRQYILEQLKICPQMRDTNIYLKLVEAFPDIQVKRATFYRYMKSLREQHGYQHASKRKTSPREISPPGYN